jgi:exopolysaccharide biosynthesis polyprenyl glycosylphosphotransferase
VSRTRWIVLSLLADIVLLNAAMVASFYVRFRGFPQFNFQAYSNLAFIITALFVLGLWIYGLYEIERSKSAWEITWSVAKATTLGILGTVVISFFVRLFSFPRVVFAISWAFCLVALAGWRLLATSLLPLKWPKQRVLIVGTGPQAVEIAHELSVRGEWGYEVVGFLSGEGEGDAANALGQDESGEQAQDLLRRAGEPGAPPGARLLGRLDDIGSIVRANAVDRVIVASPVGHREVIEDLALSDEAEVSVEVIPELYEIFIGTVDTLVSDIPLMQLTGQVVPGWVVAWKRAYDVVGSLALIVVLSPLLLLAALAVKLSSAGPVFYRQERVGWRGRLFKVIKFRTMVAGAESLSGPVMATEDDTRVTLAGRFLRRYRIDELPQLFNILKGEMSFVGPRPERPYFVERFGREVPGYRERLKAKPGVTGLAQVNGSYATTAQNKLKFDLIYMYHQSLLMDLRILFETVRVVLTGRGAR